MITYKIAAVKNDKSVMPYSTWLTNEILRVTENFTKKFTDYTNEDIINVENWLYETQPDVTNKTIDDIIETVDQWTRQNLIKNYPTNNVVYEFDNGFKIVKLTSGDFAIEKQLMERDLACNFSAYSSGEKELTERMNNETTIFYSLRTPQNEPIVSLQLSTPDGQDKNKTYDIKEILARTEEEGAEKTSPSYSYDEPKPEYIEMIKKWFNELQKSGYRLYSEVTEYKDEIDVNDLPRAMENSADEDLYGIPISLPGIGGCEENYYENLQEAYGLGASGSHWIQSISREKFDAILFYAERHHELDKLQKAVEGFSSKEYDQKMGKSKEIHRSFQDLVSDWFFDYECNINFENERPNEEEMPTEEDYMVIDTSPNQPEFANMPEGKPHLTEEGRKQYEQDLKEYQEKEKAWEEEYQSYEENFEPYMFMKYVWKELQDSLKMEERKNKEISKKEKPPKRTSTTMLKIHKISQRVEEKDMPKADVLAAYVESLKMYRDKNNQLKPKFIKLIDNLPSPRQIKQDFSSAECRLLYETVGYLWKKITKQDIIEESKIERAPETLLGNYWLLKNGILLHGVNHYGIIKNNASMICTLLKINGFALEEYLYSGPNKLIKFIIKNGGTRMFINKNKELFCQMSPETYGKWGKKKIKKYDFEKKVVRVIDLSVPFKGWKSGIAILL